MRSRGPMRLVKTLRGQGELRWGSRQVRAVSYAIDFYLQGPLRTAAGVYTGMPEFAVKYKDYTGTDISAKWPSDATLRGKLLHGGEERRCRRRLVRHDEDARLAAAFGRTQLRDVLAGHSQVSDHGDDRHQEDEARDGRPGAEAAV